MNTAVATPALPTIARASLPGVAFQGGIFGRSCTRQPMNNPRHQPAHHRRFRHMGRKHLVGQIAFHRRRRSHPQRLPRSKPPPESTVLYANDRQYFKGAWYWSNCSTGSMTAANQAFTMGNTSGGLKYVGDPARAVRRS